MATVPRAALDYTTRQVNALSFDAQKKVLNVLESVDWDTVGVSAGRELVVQALQAVLPTYTAAAAQAGADLYDAVRLLQVGEALGATAISGYNPDATDGAVRAFAQDIVGGKGTESFNRSVLDRVDYEVRRAANMSVAENAALDPLKTYYARVPTGFETCEFCTMLASFGYLPASRKPALHVHSNCDCRLVQAYDGMEIEGYNPDAYDKIWQKIKEMKAAGVSVTQRKAVLATMHSRLISTSTVSSIELSELYQAGMKSAWSDFKSAGKTEEAYQATVEAYLKNIGDAAGGSFSAEFMAQPTSEEIWAAVQLSGMYGSLRFRYAEYSSKNPDFLLNGELAELKTPESQRKVTNRLMDISHQFEPYPDERKLGILSALYLAEEEEYTIKTAQRFVDDGTLDEVVIIRSDGSLERLT